MRNPRDIGCHGGRCFPFAKFTKPALRNFVQIGIALATMYGVWIIMLDVRRLQNIRIASVQRASQTGEAAFHRRLLPFSTPRQQTTVEAYESNSTMVTLMRLAQFWSDPPECEALRAGDNYTAEYLMNDTNVTEIGWNEYVMDSCEAIRARGYILNESVLSEEERSFPLAFSILMYTSVWQFERLLRAIYRPQNTYCVHVDLRANESLFAAVSHVVSCFHNVLLPERIAVHWGTRSVIDAELSCMQTLRDRSATWRYFINLTGQEFPLQTMWQVVRDVRSLNGSNSVDSGCPPHPSYQKRLTNVRHFAAKFDVTPCVGSTHVVLLRAFVEHLLENPFAKMLHTALADAEVPDETFFGTLDHNSHLGLPGSVDFRTPIALPFRTEWNRLKNWIGHFPCHGKYVHQVCIWGVADLPFITNSTRRELFTNKLYWDYQHFTLDCLESWYWNRTVVELLHHWFHSASN